MKINYSLALEKTLAEINNSGGKKKLLLHSCCAPCSSYVLEYIAKYFDLTLFFYNPNISPRSEFDFRLSELERFSAEAGYNAKIISPEYVPSEFFEKVKGYEDFPEGAERCRICYELRLEKTAEEAAHGGLALPSMV